MSMERKLKEITNTEKAPASGPNEEKQQLSVLKSYHLNLNSYYRQKSHRNRYCMAAKKNMNLEYQEYNGAPYKRMTVIKKTICKSRKTNHSPPRQENDDEPDNEDADVGYEEYSLKPKVVGDSTKSGANDLQPGIIFFKKSSPSESPLLSLSPSRCSIM